MNRDSLLSRFPNETDESDASSVVSIEAEPISSVIRPVFVSMALSGIGPETTYPKGEC